MSGNNTPGSAEASSCREVERKEKELRISPLNSTIATSSKKIEGVIRKEEETVIWCTDCNISPQEARNLLKIADPVYYDGIKDLVDDVPDLRLLCNEPKGPTDYIPIRPELPMNLEQLGPWSPWKELYKEHSALGKYLYQSKSVERFFFKIQSFSHYREIPNMERILKRLRLISLLFPTTMYLLSFGNRMLTFLMQFEGIPRLDSILELTEYEISGMGNEIRRIDSLTSLSLWYNKDITDAGFFVGRSPVSKDPLRSSFTRLTSLDIRSNGIITDAALSLLTCLTSLNLSGNEKITDLGLVPLTGLTSLYLYLNKRITNAGLIGITKLTSLDLQWNEKITGVALTPLTDLSFLNLDGNAKITDADLSLLTGLTHLNLWRNTKITDAGLTSLTSLTSLKMPWSKTITDTALNLLTGLTHLDISGKMSITDVGLTSLTSLTSLNLWYNKWITDAALRLLTGLTYLNLSDNGVITDAGLVGLTGLTRLDLSKNKIITDAGLIGLTELSYLKLHNNSKITRRDLKSYISF